MKRYQRKTRHNKQTKTKRERTKKAQNDLLSEKRKPASYY